MKTVFAIGAHPDDIEFLMSGTLLALQKKGYEIHYMNVANGCYGSTKFDAPTTASVRREESMEVCKSVGFVYHESLCDDLGIFYDRPMLLRLASEIRAVAPQIVLTHSPVDYMEDHTNTSRLVVTAAFTRAMPNYPVDPPRKPVEQRITVYHAQPYRHCDQLGKPVEPDIVVDVSEFVDMKVKLLSKHASQIEWLDASQGISAFLQSLRDLDAECARMAGGLFAYAEGWRKHSHMGYCDESDDPLCHALKERVSRFSRP